MARDPEHPAPEPAGPTHQHATPDDASPIHGQAAAEHAAPTLQRVAPDDVAPIHGQAAAEHAAPTLQRVAPRNVAPIHQHATPKHPGPAAEPESAAAPEPVNIEGAEPASRPGVDPAPALDWIDTVWDVLVVGAGPAGSTAARTAALAGATVLLLDRAPFPRYKTCGGGLLGESLRLIPERARATIESRVADSLVTSRFRRPFRLRQPEPYLAMVRRIEFDQALVEAAQDAGARFVDGIAVREITQPGDPLAAPAGPPPAPGRSPRNGPAADDRDPPDARARSAQGSADLVTAAATDAGAPATRGPAEGDAARPADARTVPAESDQLVTVRTSAGTVRARVVIGADGTGGRIGRYVGVVPGGIDLGLEDEVAMPADDTRWRDTVYLDWGGASGSYAWVFPKGDSLTVGVIQRKGAPDATRDYLAAWRAHLGLAGAETLHSSGHLTQWRTGTSPLRRGRVIVAGDAAGLLEPWTREGISFALRSGAWAGQAAASAARLGTSTTPAADFPPTAPATPTAAAPRSAPATPNAEVPPTAAVTPTAPATPTAAVPRSASATPTAAASADPLAAYGARVDAELGAEMRAGAAVLAAFERHRGLVHAMLRSRRGARYFVRFCRGETSLARFARHRWAMRIVRALG
ncbi:FAD-dependent monooxygenase [Herbiconiux ginsengi]|uniref:FAD dependent oxidoreductase n=1 Tax=Herbiconiux ginsengi TaxID=381665 RepID=A0A1H3QKA1_9MICO|nr:FAD-dependent monooxygenase [Herbiconiux ginsengi]SDZ13740.1 FAD dependent oxidoreductase [Herbiconiux ginsengi]